MREEPVERSDPRHPRASSTSKLLTFPIEERPDADGRNSIEGADGEYRKGRIEMSKERTSHTNTFGPSIQSIHMFSCPTIVQGFIPYGHDGHYFKKITLFSRSGVHCIFENAKRTSHLNSKGQRFRGRSQLTHFHPCISEAEVFIHKYRIFTLLTLQCTCT